MRVKLAIVGAAVLALAAFSPPQPRPEGVQQAPPKSWIPDAKPKQERPIALDVAPKQPSAYRHAPAGLACAGLPNGPFKVKKEFVESYNGARMAAQAGNHADALRFAEVAGGYAQSAQEWSGVEAIRVAALTALQNKPELIASLEAALATNCLPQDQAAKFREMLDDARKQ
jgi:hypothetical protein